MIPVAKTSVRFFAPFDVQSGLGTAARAILSALQKAPVDLSLSNYNIGHEAHPRVAFRAPQLMLPINQPLPIDITIAFHNADSFENFTHNTGTAFLDAKRKRVAHWVWELSELPKFWSHHAPSLDEVWTPTEFVREAVMATYSCPVRVVPYPVNITTPAATSFRERFKISTDEFLMCTMFDASSFVDRKNPLPLFKALQELRARGVPARVLMKVTHPHLLAEYVKSKNFDLSSVAGLSIFSESLDHESVLGLINEADCLVSAHRSEGFGLTVAEALMLGKPVVATDYGGTRDFLTEETGFPVPYKMKAIESDLGPYKAGCSWADIDQEALVTRLLEVASDVAAAHAKGARGRELIATKFSPTAISKTLMNEGLL